jgi:lipopolysaccharide biosynthesis protein
VKRLTIFAHFDPDNKLDDYVLFYLRELRIISTTIIFVSSSVLSPADQDRLLEYVDEVHMKDNQGYDFASWQLGLKQVELGKFQQIVLCNDSCYGPLEPLAPIFDLMGQRGGDFWGMTRSYQYQKHLQSYFLVFNSAVFESDAFKKFWLNIVPKDKKIQIVLSYEVGLSRRLEEAGFRDDAYFQWSFRHGLVFIRAYLQSFMTDPLNFKKLRHRHLFNVTHTFWELLLDEGVPFIKIELLKKNPLHVDISTVERRFKEKSPEFYGIIKRHLGRFS